MEHVISQAVAYTNAYKAFVEQLKKEGVIYPEVMGYHKLDSNYLATIVRIERGGKWYRVLIVQSYPYSDIVDIYEQNNTYIRLIAEVHRIVHLYRITGIMENLDEDQRSEAQRIEEDLTYHP